MSSRRRSLLLTLGCCVMMAAVSSASASAQQTPPTLIYSRTSRAFDGNPPVGVRFQVRGTVEPATQAVRLETFGFPGAIPEGFRGDATAFEFCQARIDAANRADVSHNVVAWDRADPDARQYSVFHPPLFYGRRYVFLFTFFVRANTADAQARLRDEVVQVLQGLDFERLYARGLTPEELADEVLARLPSDQCQAFVDRGGGVASAQIREVVRRSAAALAPLAQEATRRHALRVLADARGDTELRTNGLGYFALSAAPGATVAALRASLQAEDYVAALQTVTAALGASPSADEQARLRALAQRLAEPAAEQGRVATVSPADFQVIARDLVAPLSTANFTETLAATAVTPLFESTMESLPFLLSIDGGLMFVHRFNELIPTVAVNVKLNRVDFNDPLSRRVELSMLVGLGMSAPDDLDPDYRGLFGAQGSRSLVMGFGLRIPAISPLVRFQAGSLWYRQVSENPLVRDLTTNRSFYVGASANWDVLDFTSRLISGRATLRLGAQ